MKKSDGEQNGPYSGVDVGFSRGWKLVTVLQWVMCIIFGVYGWRVFALQDNLLYVYMVIAPFCLMVTAGIIHNLIVRIRVTEAWVRKAGLLKRTLHYSDITTIGLNRSSMLLKAGWSTIYITREFEERERLFQFIADRLRDRPDISIRGDRTMIERYFGAAADGSPKNRS